MSSKENLLYFDYYNINAKEYFRQKYEIINKNNNNNKISEEPKVEESDDEKNSPQNTPSSFDDLSYPEDNENENEETESKKSEEFPLDGFDVFDYSKLIITQNDESYNIESQKEEKIESIYSSTLPTKPKKRQIKIIKKDKDEVERTNNFHRDNNKTKNEKSSSSGKKCIRERSRSK